MSDKDAPEEGTQVSAVGVRHFRTGRRETAASQRCQRRGKVGNRGRERMTEHGGQRARSGRSENRARERKTRNTAAREHRVGEMRTEEKGRRETVVREHGVGHIRTAGETRIQML